MKLIKQLSTLDPGFHAALDALLSIQAENHQSIYPIVRQIIDEVRHGGDAALLALTVKLDRRSVVAAA